MIADITGYADGSMYKGWQAASSYRPETKKGSTPLFGFGLSFRCNGVGEIGAEVPCQQRMRQTQRGLAAVVVLCCCCVL